jgi:3-hydroxypropanoate dehydrogenase
MIVYYMSPTLETICASTSPTGERPSALPPEGLDLIFRTARSQNAWRPIPVADALLQQIYELARLGPTATNSCPARFRFLRTPEAKDKLRPALAPGNVAKVMTAPVVVIIGHDLQFFEQLPQLFPHRDVAPGFRSDPGLAQRTAFRNGSLQGAYLMIAARALGLDCGPMSGFDNRMVDDLFFPGTAIRSNFLCAMGYGDPAGVLQRLPRLSFGEACELM